jgi:hypothetical protein
MPGPLVNGTIRTHEFSEVVKPKKYTTNHKMQGKITKIEVNAK